MSDAVEVLLECPDVPDDVERQYRDRIRRHGIEDDDDDRFDDAFDFVLELPEDVMPWNDEYEEADVDCVREWAYELLRRIGKPYGGHETPSPDVRLRPSGVQEALEVINQHRRRVGQPELDPEEAGWSDQDILAEADRLRRVNPQRLRRLLERP